MPPADTDISPPLSLGFLSELLGYHLRLAHIAMRRDLDERLSAFELTQKQSAALCLIAWNEGVSQIDVAATLDTDRSTMMALIDRLEERRLITRRKSRADGRRQELRVTSQGAALASKLNELVREQDRKFTQRFPPGELAGLIEALRRIHQRP